MRNKGKIKTILTLGIILVLSFINISIYQGKIDKSIENLNDSDLKNSYYEFEPAFTLSVGNGPTGIFIADVNYDGYNDIVTSNLMSGDVSILLWNNLSSNWEPQQQISVGTQPEQVFVGDANNDGFNDIVTSNSVSSDVSIILWNEISGNWDPQITETVGGGPHDINIGDANHDGYNDIITANEGGDSVSILLWNDTSSGWDPKIDESVGQHPWGVFLGDANNDGYNDIVTANRIDNNISILLWNDTLNQWNSQLTEEVGYEPMKVFIGDANNDGYNDIVSANLYGQNVSIILWNKTSGYWDAQIKKPGRDSSSIFIGDANIDGYNDIITGNSNSVSILFWEESSSDWKTPVILPATGNTADVFLGDANNDGYNDIVTANYPQDNVAIMLFNSTPPSIWIDTPRNRTHTMPTKGYFLGSFGFENDEFGTKPDKWISSGEVFVIDELDGHKKLARMRDLGTGSSSSIRQMFSSLQQNGTIEWWWRTTDSSEPYTFIMRGSSSNLFRFRINDYEFQYDNGTWNSLGLSAYDNVWYHVKIAYECTTGDYEGLNQFEWCVWINNSRYGNFRFSNNDITGESITFSSDNLAAGYNMYLDAVGYSWDPYYNIGDNLKEGLLLSFHTNFERNWTAYSIDDQPYRMILGNITIKMPNEGKHHIQVFSNVSNGILAGSMVQSDIRYFTIDTIIPEIFINKPTQNEVFGTIPPNFTVSINEINLVSTWYSLDGGITNVTFTGLTGRINQSEWDKKGNGSVIVIFYARDKGDHENSAKITIQKDIHKPEIFINEPIQDGFFGTIAPNFNISIIEEKLNTTWYSLDGGSTNITFTGFTGKINQTEWDKRADGLITIRFYANDSVANENFLEVSIFKDTLAPISALIFEPYRDIHIVNRSTIFTLSADDGAGSGIAILRYKINDSIWIDYTGAFNLSEYDPGDYLISFQAIDEMGNTELINTVLVTLVEIPEGENPLILIVIVISSILGIVGITALTIIILRRRKRPNEVI
ncbi:MAG: FG-GAP repeat domain-containing protein [Promethearchaeota archaeon]